MRVLLLSARQPRPTTATLLPTAPAPAIRARARRHAVRARRPARPLGAADRGAAAAATPRASARSTRRGRRARSRAGSRSASCASGSSPTTPRRRPALRRRASRPRRRRASPAGALGGVAARRRTRSTSIDPLGNLVLRWPRDPGHQGARQGSDAAARGVADRLMTARSRCGKMSRCRRRRCRVRRRTTFPMTTLALAENRLRQFLALTKPRVVSLIVFCAVIGMFLAVPGLPPRGARVLRARSASRWSPAPRRRSIAWSSRRSTRVMARTRRAAAAARRAHVRARRCVFAGVVGGVGPVRAVRVRQSADDVADAGDVRRLRDHLHGAAQARDAAEHRHRRRVGRDAAGAGLGGGDQRRVAPRR